MTRTILIAGATGMLGSKITRALLNKDSVDLRLMAPRGEITDRNKRDLLEECTRRGVQIVEADLTNKASLDRATKNVDVVISAVQGGSEVIIDGQMALAEAAVRNGTRRFIPSDFAVDLFKLNYDEHVFLSLRRRADEAIATLGIGQVNVLNGAFIEVLLGPYMNIFDFKAGRISFWGDGETKIDMTTTGDTACYVAEAALDQTLPSGKFSIAGDQLTMNDMIQACEKVFGKTFERRSLGSVADLERWIAQAKTHAASVNEYAPAQYHYAMVSGKAQLTNLVNDRYPHIRPTTFRGYLEKAKPLLLDVGG